MLMSESEGLERQGIALQRTRDYVSAPFEAEQHAKYLGHCAAQFSSDLSFGKPRRFPGKQLKNIKALFEPWRRVDRSIVALNS
jgi:hypothetical protein